MSLKGKIEAVIYAAEEPVTLAQLISLLGLEGQAELDRAKAAQRTLPLGPEGGGDDEDGGIPLPSEPDLLNEEVFTVEEDLEFEEVAGDSAVEEETPAGEAAAGTEPEEVAEAPGAGADGAEPEMVEAEAGADGLEIAEPPQPLDERQLAREAKERERALREYFRRVLDELMRDYAVGDRGLEIREVANGFRMATKPEYHDAVRGFAKSLKPPLKLSLQALETLAVVAYKQPVTAPEVSEIRGVDSGGVLGSLMARKLVTTAGRKQVIGRPILYKTTKDFLLRFGLKDIGELPSIEEFEKMAGELAEQEEIPMAEAKQEQAESVTGADLREEQNATEPQADGDAMEGMPVDGRLSGPPVDEAQPVDSPAGDAAIQQDEASEGTED